MGGSGWLGADGSVGGREEARVNTGDAAGTTGAKAAMDRAAVTAEFLAAVAVGPPLPAAAASAVAGTAAVVSAEAADACTADTSPYQWEERHLRCAADGVQDGGDCEATPGFKRSNGVVYGGGEAILESTAGRIGVRHSHY